MTDPTARVPRVSTSIGAGGFPGWRVLTALTLMALVSACTGGAGVKTSDPMAALEQRAIERWQKVIDHDYPGAYAYLTEGYRKSRSEREYAQFLAARTAFKWKSAAWQKVECASADSCVATVEVSYEIMLPGAGPAFSVFSSNERWLKQRGQWYYLPEQ